MINKNLHLLTTKITINQLLNVQAHIGNKTSKWNPLTKNFLFGSRYNIYIFDLKQTSPFLKRMLFFITNATKNHQLLLFIGANPIVTVLIKYLEANTKQSSISRKWVSGTLTNWLKIRPYIKFLYNTNITKIREKFVLRTEKKIEQKIIQYLKMKHLFSGIERLPAIPNIIILLEKESNTYPLMEAFQLMLPVVSIVNTGPKNSLGISFPIFGNDFLFETLFFYTTLILQAIRNGNAQKRLSFLARVPCIQNPLKKKKNAELIVTTFSKKLYKINLFFRIYRDYRVLALKRMLRRILK